MAREDSRQYNPSPIAKGEECIECGERLREHEEFWIGLSKAIVCGVAGLITCACVGEIVHVHIQAIVAGKPGLGIDLNWIVVGLFGFLGAIIKWAFKGGDKK